MADDNLSWRDQLSKVRTIVTDLEKKRETERRLQRERNEEALQQKLKTDTPEALTHRFNELRKRFDRAARRFYPLPHIESVLQEISEFGDLLRFYADCMKSFPKVFTPNHKTGIPSLLGELGELQRGLERQLNQWRVVKDAVDKVRFRPPTPADGPSLVSVAKVFSGKAYDIPLSIPGDYFVHESQNFWVADLDGKAIGYVKFLPADGCVTFSFVPPGEVNFNKFTRGILSKFHAEGPLAKPLETVRVRISYVREVKFFTDMGFVRAETKGLSEWIYTREL